MEALQACLTSYNAGTSQRLELVFFSEAIKHAARLSRILVSDKYIIFSSMLLASHVLG